MRKFGARVLAAIVASSLIVTPVMAAPSIDDLKEDKAEKQSEVNSLQEELTRIISKINGLEEDLVKKGEEIIEADTVILALGLKAEQGLYNELIAAGKEAYLVGDAVKAGKIFDAIHTAYRAAIRI